MNVDLFISLFIIIIIIIIKYYWCYDVVVLQLSERAALGAQALEALSNGQPVSDQLTIDIIAAAVRSFTSCSVQWRRQESEIGWGQSFGVLGVPSGVQGQSPGGGPSPPEAEKHDINFVLRITLVHAYCPLLFLIIISSRL